MTLLLLGTKLSCAGAGCGKTLGIIDKDFIEVVYRGVNLTITGEARLRVRCPYCGHVAHYRLLTNGAEPA